MHATRDRPALSYDPDEFDFAAAIDRYKRLAHRPFPTWSEVLEVAISQGYRLVAPAGPLPGYTPPPVEL